MQICEEVLLACA